MGLNLYQALGGTATCRKLSAAFYARVDRDPVLRPLFPGKSLHCAIEELAAFLVQFLGGPSEDSQRRWWLSLRESHLRHKIGQPEREAWMKNMIATLDEAEIDEPVRSALRSFFAESSAYLVNVGPAAAPADDSLAGQFDEELSGRWSAQRALDEAVAAVRAADADRAMALANIQPLHSHLQTDRAIHAGLLGLMIRGRTTALVRYAREQLLADPALAQVRYSGHTLLHEAAAAGCLEIVELLLHLGADPNVTDDGAHTPLYSVANECTILGAGNVVRALAQAGADVNARDGAKRCTALHMAARRGHVEAATALLDCGAQIDIKDTSGETPLRRAVNCNKPEIAALLVARGADIHSIGSKGLTPSSAARTAAMKRVLQGTSVSN